jgi:hypothetical protein
MDFVVAQRSEKIVAPERAERLFVAFNERHIALTPALAQHLASLELATIPAHDPFWGRAFRRAGEAIGLGQIIGGSAFWAGALPQFPMMIAEPVLRAAASKLKRTHLFGAAVLGDPFGFSEVTTALERGVSQALDDMEVMGRGFWVTAAIALYGAATVASLARAGRSADLDALHTLPPEPDPVLCRLLFEAEPIFPEDQQHLRRRRVRQRAALRKRSGVRPKEGGVAGIRMSTLQEDFPDAVMSELILPEEMLADRLLHEGLIVRYRPPLREPKRDLLSFCMNGTETSAGAALAKAAWADASLRLQFLLGQIGLERSDLIWATAQGPGLAASVLRADGIKPAASLDPMALAGHARAEMLVRSGLFPGFSDTLPRYPNPALRPSDFTETLPHLAAHALRRMREVALSTAPPRKGVRPEPPRPADYSRHLAIAFLPASSPEGRRAVQDWSGFRVELQASLSSQTRKRAQCAALCWPDTIERGQVFQCFGDSAQASVDIAVPDSENPMEAVQRMLGLLSGWIIDVTLEAVNARQA